MRADLPSRDKDCALSGQHTGKWKRRKQPLVLADPFISVIFTRSMMNNTQSLNVMYVPYELFSMILCIKSFPQQGYLMYEETNVEASYLSFLFQIR
jgi:hypothetical protein